MPNWCNTEVVFIGENVEKLYNDWQKANKKFKKEGDQGWLGRLFMYRNVTMPIQSNEKAEILGRLFKEPYCRSFINDIHMTQKDTLLMSTLDAWKPVIDAYNKIADMYNLNFVVKAEEPGQEIYLNTDATGKYFPERYIFEFFCNSYIPYNLLVNKLNSLDAQRYFSSFTQVSEILSGYGVKTEEDMEYFCEYIRNKYPDCIINFHEYEEEL
ncbi:hypothetical protein [Thermoanaerobacterium sp. RBIITD]|uniref:hypothetical protein n=1 Tax=Thermoanaerobacterium sp. RBIITD TaxID=1550240 RepID=UPI000BB9740D|nr:hypothetical protein [Thermoanaerobacterium sp. RBIITD]SNX54184.1 hypothetical protein SAMN05660242_1820 [Thermoanaerobacterium sp. RBIITD]